LLKLSFVTEKFPFPGALIFNAPARWSKDPLQETRRAGDVFPQPPRGRRTARCKIDFLRIQALPRGFLRENPAAKQTNKNTSD
jgi:hypothetical protein